MAKNYSAISRKWHIYFENMQETFFQRLDRVINEWNRNYPEDAIDWVESTPNCTAKEENLRRIQLREKLMRNGIIDDKIARRWIPSVKADENGYPIEPLSSEKEVTDPSLSSGEERTRENILKFCASLKLNGNQTETLLHTVFFCRSFNLKNHFELVCYFYISRDSNEKNWYEKAKGFLVRNDLESIPYQEPEEVIFTQEILTDVDAISTEDALVEYIRDHFSIFAKENQYITAKDCVDTDVSMCWKIVVREVVEEPDYASEYAGTLSAGDRKKPFDINAVEMAKLLQVIIGHTIDRKVPIKKYDEGLLPERIHKNFPTAAILQDICSGKENSMDRIRKSLILLSFYIWCTRENTKKTCHELINARLQDANLPELCEYDLYDALFMYAAANKKPLDTFREIMLQAKPG